jgi:hypothetical protein
MEMNSTVTGYYRYTKDYVDECHQQGAMDVQYFHADFTDQRDEGFVAVIPEGRVWGAAGCVITPTGKVLWDVSREWDAYPERHSIFRQTDFPPVERTDERVAVLAKIGSSNYYHWMFDVLPRLHLLNLSGIEVDKYIVPHPLASFQYETLSAFGVNRDRLIEADSHFHLQASQLLVPALPYEAKWACEFVRESMLRQVEPTLQASNRRLYISRAQCVGRTVLNEQEVIEALTPYGFTLVTPESMSVEEQVRAFAEAELIVGPQGSAFTNAFFCKPQTQIIELMAPTFVITSTEKICSYLNLGYHRLMGTSQRNPSYQYSRWYWHGLDNIHVDVWKILHVLKRLRSDF